MTRLSVAVRDGVVVVSPDELVGQLTPDGLPDDQVPPVALVVSGGLLTWPWHVGLGSLDPAATLTRPPVAVLEDVASAQEWLWALYGHDVALAVADAAGPSAAVSAVDWAPGLAWLPAAAARFAFGTWLAAWWPASTTDGIPALDPALLRAELEPLAARLDQLFDGAEPPLPGVAAVWRPAADRYALAAGPVDDGPAVAVGVSVSTGVGGTRWADLPAGWVDASDLAVSWRLAQDLDHWSFQVRAAAGPVVVVEAARLVADAPGRRVELRPDRDSFGRCWLGASTGTEPAPVPDGVRVYLPGFVPDDALGDSSVVPRSADPGSAGSGRLPGRSGPSVGLVEGWHDSVRTMARTRLAAAGAQPNLEPAAADPWRAEQAAADDDDY